ncbi:MAG TPA: tetratricopeptide repeat protein [Pyrinomonadaceae bacterium]|jgi:tetratricopeptide (TPR) repeat protein|nr:tetratricopeptide repeat protein [Pyrinomonadaceae bacterium]
MFVSVRAIRVCLWLIFVALGVHAQPAALTITTEPNAIVWIDEVRRGTTDATGKLTISKLSPGRHTVRVRANSFKEATAVLLPGRRALVVKLVGTSDPAVLMFQQAEKAREEARDDASRENAAELYREALKNPPPNAAARVGLARVLLDLNKFKEARAEIDAARRIRSVYPEASAVEGRIYLAEGFTDDAIRSFRRSIREANGFQPEAHVGLARVYEEKGDFAAAILELRKALDQLDDSEPVIYQMLGAAYEKVNKPKEAIAAYEKYLQLAPNGSYAAALRSILNQLKREAAGEEIIP